jgi:hypothetical protein
MKFLNYEIIDGIFQIFFMTHQYDKYRRTLIRLKIKEYCQVNSMRFAKLAGKFHQTLINILELN